MTYMQLRSARGNRFVYKIMVLQIAQHTKFSTEFGIVSEIIIMSSGSIVFVMQVISGWLG